MRAALLYGITWLQIPPFTWIFAGIYRLAIRVAVFFVRRHDGVCAIYLTGSITRSRTFYGLSDIDLIVLLQGTRDIDMELRLKTLFRRLKCVFPMLGSPEEKGIYFLQDFESEYHRFPLIQHLFDEKFYRRLLLWGEDVISCLDLTSLSTREQVIAAVWKIRYWIEKLVLLSESSALTGIQYRYLLYKAVADCNELLASFDTGRSGDSGASRSIEGLLHVMGPDENIVLEALQAERRSQFRREYIDPDRTFQFIRRLFACCIQRFSHVLEVELPDGTKGYSGKPSGMNTESVEAWSVELRDICGENVSVIASMPVILPASLLDTDCFDMPLLTLSVSSHLSIRSLINLRRWFLRTMQGKALLLIQECSEYRFAVHSEYLQHWIHTPLEEPHLFISSETKTKRLSTNQILLIRDLLDNHVTEIGVFLANTELKNLPGDVFLRFAFQVLRSLVMAHDIEYAVSPLVSTPELIVEYLRNNTSLNPGFLHKLLDAYEGLEATGASPNYGLMMKIWRLLETMQRLVAHGESFNGLMEINQLPDSCSLSVSVVVVTRNRASRLERCLDAIARLSRIPDQVVIVDNGSTDETESVAKGFSQSLPISYIYEPLPSIPRSRNRGIAESNGEVIAFIDDDAEVDRRWLCRIEEPFLRDASVGIVGGLIRTMYETRTDPVYRYHHLIGT